MLKLIINKMKELSNLIPIWKHDCDSCAFVGSIVSSVFEDCTDDELLTWDLYYHPPLTPGGRDSVIARYGNEGCEYQSGMVFATSDGIAPLFKAKQLAEQQGLRTTSSS
jgi:hypothetical protein